MAFKKLLLRLFLVALVLAPTTLLHARAQDGPVHAESTAGQLLVATPDIGDPRFEHAVILMIGHDRNGAFGITINRPLGKHSIADLLESIGETHDGVTGQVPIFAGGPVQEQIGFILHSPDYHEAGTKAVGEGVALTSSAAILRVIGRGKGPKKALVAFGYAGWQPGQLEAEMDQHAWVTAPLDPNLIFDTDPDKIWDLAWARRTLSL